VAALLALVVLLPGIASAAPAAPAPAGVDTATAQVQVLTAQLVDLEQQTAAAQAAVVAARQTSAIALDHYQAQAQAYADAQAKAGAAQAAAASATTALNAAQQQLADFARSSYIDGSTSAGAAALFTSADPAELVERAVLLGSAGAGRSDALQRLLRAQQLAQQADQAAQATLASAAALQRSAQEALTAAETAQRSARTQQSTLSGQETGLQTQLRRTQDQLAALVGPAAAAAIVAAARTQAETASAAKTPATPIAVPVLLGNKTLAGPGSPAKARKAITAALDAVGIPYAWGGGGASGPSAGIDLDAGVVGFDCSGLTQYAYAKAGVRIPRNSRAQFSALPKVPTRDLQPGDLVFWALDPAAPDTIHHVAIYLGNGQVVQAPESGDVVSIAPMWWDGYAGAVRPTS
jgi:cell wall-associated NlpC family hydrolase/outer membrane murein-binding lipoprotein Lpp